MLNITDAEKGKWQSSSYRKDVVISIPNLNMTLTNDDLILETMQLKESINEGTSLDYTGCIASEFTFTMRDVIQDLRGQYIEVTIAVDNESPLPLFKGYVDSQDNLNQLDRQTNVTAYDAMRKIFDTDVTSWYNGLTFPISVKNFRDSFFSQVNIVQSNATLVNDTLNITSKTLKDAVINGETIIKSICQMNAVFGQIGRDGKFKYIELKEINEGLYPAVDLYPGTDVFPVEESTSAIINPTLYSSINYEPFITDEITKVSIRDQEGLEQGAYGSTADNPYVIADNPLLWAVSMQTAAQNIYDVVSKIKFMPTELELVGLPYLEAGDVICAHTNLNNVRTYILSRTLKGIQALTDSYTSTVDQHRPEYQQSLATTVSKNGQNILEIQADIVTMNTLIADRATISQLNATNARVGSLEADHVSVASLNAVSARVGTIESDYVVTSELNAVSARVGSLEADHVTTSQLNAVKGTVTTLSSTVATINSAYIDTATCNSLINSQLTQAQYSPYQGTAYLGNVYAGRLYIYSEQYHSYRQVSPP